MSLLISGLIATSCSPQKEIIVQDIQKPKLNLENPKAPNKSSVKFHVITDNNIESKMQSQIDKNNLPVFICLTPKDYQTLSVNVQKNENYILQLQRVISSYREYYEK